MEKKKEDLLTIMVQGFYGNRTVTEIHMENFDSFMLGYLNTSLFEKEKEKIDRTMVRVPGTDHLVIVYNKYEEEKTLSDLQEFIQNLRGTEFRFNPSVVIPEMGIVLYSRCIICRINAAGEYESLKGEDFGLFMKYLAQ